MNAGKEKVCSSGKDCRHPEGPVLPLDQFYALKGPNGKTYRRRKCRVCYQAFRTEEKDFSDIERFLKRPFRSAKNGGKVPFEITFEQWMTIYWAQHGRCAATGEPFRFERTMDGGTQPKAHFYQPSPDRKDSSKGYTPANLHFVTFGYNMIKGNRSEEVMNELAGGIAGTRLAAEDVLYSLVESGRYTWNDLAVLALNAQPATLKYTRPTVAVAPVEERVLDTDGLQLTEEELELVELVKPTEKPVETADQWSPDAIHSLLSEDPEPYQIPLSPKLEEHDDS